VQVERFKHFHNDMPVQYHRNGWYYVCMDGLHESVNLTDALCLWGLNPHFLYWRCPTKTWWKINHLLSAWGKSIIAYCGVFLC